MIPRVAGSGSSFGGAALYYLHDKQQPGDLTQEANEAFQKIGDYALHDKGNRLTSDRVGFIEILNMEADTPADAIAQMNASYERYREREAHKRGRKLEKPVYAYSLAWEPGETPTREQMMEAARSSLKALRLEGLQTLIVQHTDEPQPHIHVILNRLELDGSKARPIPFDQLRFSRWAEAWEREHGGIRCQQRADNNALRKQGVFVKDTKSLSRQEYEAREREQARAGKVPEQSARKRADRNPKQLPENIALWKQQEKEREALQRKSENRDWQVRGEARARNRKLWAGLYAEQRRVLKEMRHANEGGILERAVFVYRHKPLLRYAGKMTAKDLVGLCVSERKLTQRIDRAHEKERLELADYDRFLVDGAAKIVWREHQQNAQIMGQRHKLERDMLNARVANQFDDMERTLAEHSRQRPAAPQLTSQGSMDPGDINRLLDAPRDKAPNSDQKSWTFPGDESTQDFLKRMEEYKRRNRDRDFGLEQ
jgi:hypothetical protein